MIPAGIRTGETEFMSDADQLFAMRSGFKTDVEALPAKVLNIVSNNMLPKHHEVLDRMGIKGYFPRIKQFIKCNASAADFTPDVIDGQLTFNTEYSPCPFRGKCEFEGHFCGAVNVEGQIITMALLRITSLIRAGYRDAEICDIVEICPQTLRTQKATIQSRLGADRKVGIAIKAIQYGIQGF
jgi:DNA-binding NarL/FixJ family response regulator